MNHVTIRVGEKEDTEALFPEVTKVTEGVLNKMGILEAGMQSGRTSVSLIVQVGDEHVLAQISAGQFMQMAAAVRGAAARFGEEL